MRLQMIAAQDTVDFNSGVFIPAGSVTIAANVNDFLQHIKEGFEPYFEDGRRAYWYATGNGSQLFITDDPAIAGVPVRTFFTTVAALSTMDPVVRQTVSVMPYTAAPNPDNADATIGPVAWTTVLPEDALRPGPVTMTNGADTVTENTIEGITQRLESGYQVLRPNGTAAYRQMFLGGYLIDGNPLNVLLGEPWLPEQWAAITPAIQAGVVPSPSILPADETAPAIDEGMARFAMPATIAAAAAVLWAWWRKRKGGN